MKGKYEAPVQKKNSKKGVALLLVLFLLVGCVIGTTLAWLKAETQPLTNTFTAGNITLSLEESQDLDLRMVPGQTITKDPVVTVGAKSEACYAYIHVVKANDLGLLSYSFDGWTQLPGYTDVYYRAVGASDNAQAFHVFTDDEVQVSSDMTAAQANTINATNPTITITAYAVQQDGFDGETGVAAAAAFVACFPSAGTKTGA